MSPRWSSQELPAGPEGRPTVYLLDAATGLESRILEQWIRDQRGDDAETIPIRPSRTGRGGDQDQLLTRMDADDDPFLIPTRVVWLAPRKKDRRRSVGWSELFKPGDPRDPRRLRARLIRWLRPSRMTVISGTGAGSSELRRDYEQAGEIDGLGPHVVRRAWRVLDQAERRLRGNRYKIPRFVHEAILSRGEFIESLDRFAAEAGVEPTKARAKAERYLREIAATHSTYVIDLMAKVIHTLYRQGYGEIRYDQVQVRRISELGAEQPLVFLPSHRSNMDRLSLQYMLWENDLPPNHTASGINNNFFPVGPLLRRTGVFFIRRSFKDNPLYKLVLRAYLDYLIENRFPIEWYIEGGRSRSGKLLPPRYGMLSYVVDSLRRGKADDLGIVPISIAYDHIQDISDYAREHRGRAKEKESLAWMLKAVRSLRRRYGNIHIRFGEPISVASVLGSIEEGEEVNIGLQKLAFEVMYRIGRATPVTPTAVVSIALLATRGKARTASELAAHCAGIVSFVERRGLPTTEPLDLSDPETVTAILDTLAEHDNVSSHEALGRRVFWLDDERMIRISYYRNMVVHYFVNRAIAEIALASLSEDESRQPGLVPERMLELRDLLKFEFFFSEKEQFIEDTLREIEFDAADWEDQLRQTGARSVLARMGQPVAYWALLPFLDAYQIVGDELEVYRGSFEEKPFLKACLDRARMYRIEERLISGESASQVLFKSALGLAENRGLLDGGPDLTEKRSAFAAEVRRARQLAATSLG